MIAAHDLAALRDAWRATGSLRVEGWLAADTPARLRDAARAARFELQVAPPTPLGFQYWSAAQVPDAACDHPLCELGRWLWSDGVAWVREVTGLALAPPADRQIVTTLYDKGSYLDPHNDFDERRQVAFVYGLTEERWPAEEGGWLEFLDVDPDGVRVTERRSPGWNTLDLFDVRKPDRTHAVPILRRRAERRAIIGWLY